MESQSTSSTVAKINQTLTTNLIIGILGIFLAIKIVKRVKKKQ
jgi:hypothetical protein